MAVVALVVLLLAEGAARVIATRFPEPLEFYDPVAQAKDTQLRHLSRSGGADVVVTGPSSTLFGVDPDELGRSLRGTGSSLTVYNAGITAGVPPITVDWMERFVLPRARPTTVVWVLSTVDLNDGHRLDAVDTYFRSLAGRSDAWARLTRRASDVSALVRHRSQLRSPKAWADALRGRPGAVEGWNARLTPGGLATFEELPLNELARLQLLDQVQHFKVGGANTSLVRSEVRRMTARGIKVVLAEAPLPERAVVLHPGGDRAVQAVRRELRAIAGATGAKLLELPSDLRDNSLYQDYTHLTRAGAERYTDHLAAGLR